MISAQEFRNRARWLSQFSHVVPSVGGKVEQWPSLAAPISSTAGTPAWTNSAYTQIFAASTITVPFMVAGIMAGVRGTLTTSMREIDIAVGAATSEVVIGTLRVGHINESLVGVLQGRWSPLSYSSYVAANARLAVRSRSSVAGVVDYVYVHTQRISARPGRIADVVGLSTVIQTAEPAAANSTSATSSATIYTYGSYAQVIASASRALALVGIANRGWVAGLGAIKNALLQVAVGAATSEVVICEAAQTYTYQTTAGVTEDNTMDIPNPIYIPSGTRLAIRCANGNTAALAHLAALNLVPYPMR